LRAQVLSYVDSLLLTDTAQLDILADALPGVMENVRPSAAGSRSAGGGGQSSAGTGPHKFYAIAALANATAHPRLAEVVKLNGGLQLARDMERQSLANLHILGSRVGDCAQAMLYRLSDKREGEAKAASMKFK
jgi:hypothetical protein